MAVHHQGGGYNQRAIGNGAAAEAVIDHPSAHRHQDQEKGPEQFREQTAALVAIVPKVELTNDGVRGSKGTQSRVWGRTLRINDHCDSPSGRLLPFKPAGACRQAAR
jgi:hypothetical protein